MLPAFNVIDAGAPGVPVAVNVTGAKLPHVAVNVFAPATVPSVQLPSVAMPLVVVAAPPVIEPPPVATAKVTAVPLVITAPN